MNKTFLTFGFIILTLTFLSACNQEDPNKLPADLINNPISADGDNDLSALPKFEFVSTEHDFGKLIEGVKVSFKYKFKNVGGADLVIMQVKPSCGCTATSFSKEPVPPGGTGVIELTFDSSHQPGKNFKTASVIANTQPNTIELKLRAEVVPADQF